MGSSSQVATDIRACLERLNETRSSSQEPCRQHTFLVLDKTVQAVPWESLPSFRSQSFSRIPTLAHLHDLQCLLDKRLDDGRESLDHLELDGNRTFYLVNPGGDLPRTQSTFEPWLSKNEHWDGIIGRPPMSIEIEGALSKSDIFM